MPIYGVALVPRRLKERGDGMRTERISEEAYFSYATQSSVLVTHYFYRAPCIYAFLSNLRSQFF